MNVLDLSTLYYLLSECLDLKEMPPVARGLRGMLQRPVKNAAIPFSMSTAFHKPMHPYTILHNHMT
jgi:hypothetical protein